MKKKYIKPEIVEELVVVTNSLMESSIQLGLDSTNAADFEEENGYSVINAKQTQFDFLWED